MKKVIRPSTSTYTDSLLSPSTNRDSPLRNCTNMAASVICSIESGKAPLKIKLLTRLDVMSCLLFCLFIVSLGRSTLGPDTGPLYPIHSNYNRAPKGSGKHKRIIAKRRLTAMGEYEYD